MYTVNLNLSPLFVQLKFGIIREFGAQLRDAYKGITISKIDFGTLE